MRRVVFSSVVVAEAYLVRSLLEHYGLRARLRGEHLVGLGVGIGFADGMAEVWVPAEEEAEARRILDGLREEAPPEGLDAGARAHIASVMGAPPLEACPRCGAEWEPGFAVCWRCEHEPG